MKKIFALTAAALMASVSVSFAQMEQEGNWYVIDGQGGSKLIVGAANPEGMPLLMGENDAAPADCAAGSFWQMADGTVVSCDDETAMFDARTTTADELAAMQEEIPNTEPYAENSMMLVPRDAGNADQGDTGSATQSN